VRTELLKCEDVIEELHTENQKLEPRDDEQLNDIDQEWFKFHQNVTEVATSLG